MLKVKKIVQNTQEWLINVSEKRNARNVTRNTGTNSKQI